ncbi:uncharacterized protein BXIN_1060 [Babesia sp. Xinjiang]|uniref:uncharacterized protein n=1 Tax=Babesia sp. Xinjiang TaxID=462227 RepID=UPI000A218553|nr:uncharacterized protein BXIN_1060 [Babesia sp. Xinjiang]ORM41981.1 hypothetical protein BXIN_1060 [Babesia sp. Xinjiang]
MRLYLIYAILSVPLLCAAVGDEAEPKFKKVEKESDIDAILEHIISLSESSDKGGARLAAKIIQEKATTKQQVFQIAYRALKRTPFSGLLPRCLCKLVNCALAPCYSMCTSSEADPHAVDDVIKEIKQKRTTAATAVADAIGELRTTYRYKDDVIKAAYEQCKSEESKLLPCMVKELYVQKSRDEHSLHVCTFHYLLALVVQCSVDCFARYNVNCLECVGKPIPNLMSCMKDAAEDHIK